jgi:hypothetical protein
MIVEVRQTHVSRATVGAIRRYPGRGAGVGKVKNAGAEKARRAMRGMHCRGHREPAAFRAAEI